MRTKFIKAKTRNPGSAQGHSVVQGLRLLAMHPRESKKEREGNKAYHTTLFYKITYHFKNHQILQISHWPDLCYPSWALSHVQSWLPGRLGRSQFVFWAAMYPVKVLLLWMKRTNLGITSTLVCPQLPSNDRCCPFSLCSGGLSVLPGVKGELPRSVSRKHAFTIHSEYVVLE